MGPSGPLRVRFVVIIFLLVLVSSTITNLDTTGEVNTSYRLLFFETVIFIKSRDFIQTEIRTDFKIKICT